jgi:4-hydroxy-tetrahydrodipicolinate reductase
MGRAVCEAVAAAEDLALHSAIDPKAAGSTVAGVEILPSLADLPDGGGFRGTAMEVAVDFTHASAVLENADFCLSHGIHVVIGTTGLSTEDLDELRRLAGDGPGHAFVAPNFALGAVLLMRFAAAAARHFDAAEIVELHHDGKADAPSGTAVATARAIGQAREGAWRAPGGDDAFPGARGSEIDGVRVHAVRLPGLLAHQEVLFGGPGQTLSIRHDTTDRAAFMPGVLMAIRAVGSRPGLTVGLDALFD